MWRMWTELEKFPYGFDHCEIALEGKIFEASHTYRVKGAGKYLTIIEEDGRRHFKAYLADSLDGNWTPLADTEQRPFAGAANIRTAPGVTPWTDNISHGELIRDGFDPNAVSEPGPTTVYLSRDAASGQRRKRIWSVPMADRHAAASLPASEERTSLIATKPTSICLCIRRPTLFIHFGILWMMWSSAGNVDAVEPVKVEVTNVRRAFDNGEHNAFTDLIRFHGRYYLTFRSCPDGHMVHPTSSIIVLVSDDLLTWQPRASISSETSRHARSSLP